MRTMTTVNFPTGLSGDSDYMIEAHFNYSESFLQDVDETITKDMLDDETKDIADVAPLIPSIIIPDIKQGPPERTVFAGRYNFNLEINGKDTNKKKYLYSNMLNRIYVDIKTNFVLYFNYDQHLLQGPVFVRGTVVFADETQAQNRVERCIQHQHDTQDVDINKMMNVLHSASPVGAQGVYYGGCSSQPDTWYSVVLMLSKPAPHTFQFGCKHSCPGGINRRLIEIIFTLEDHRGEVLGRQVVGARACSCPKRDIKHDEEVTGVHVSGKKRRINTTPQSQTKRVKVEVIEDSLTLPPIEIPRVDIMVAGLTTMLHMTTMAAELATDQQEAEKLKKSADELRTKINEYTQNTH